MSIEHLLAPDARLEKVAGGFTWVEGPCWIPARGVLRFSDIPGNQVLEYSEATGAVAVVSAEAEFTNGRTLSRDGSVVECSHGRRAVQRDRGASTPGAPYAPEVLVDRYGTARLNSPNDVVETSDGALWFTDPSYGIKRPAEGHAGEEEYGDRYVFRLDPSGALTPVVIDVEAPNGLAFSPDETVLYVSDSSLSPADPDGTGPERPRGHAIRAYDVIEGRHAKNGRQLAEVNPGLPDGFRVDAAGNLWTSSLSGIQVLSPAGEKLGEIPVPEKVANCCFGGADGRTLYVCASTGVHRIRTATVDARDARGQERS
ncbi:SMP-30/gluconolactonase/LRE family protein [Brachybacterium saurashtrense]|uniref:SMP-30/gluconolactonase/LRE family protein n=1 Tax=Brachybacterium saurashtrense TaxID=556288 RepID=A0A345YT09_9MICO|nr:SMP-30/gluconolactonase/LRE family protein [Brachybacterium saurashtrense]AXK47061.1 SMP-30/gluconolactonase/LRE family protein [Brachybacterium saurashtrense]RRR20910.1 SMP-30/gluconolactonase/LRE family protein [Brachybacterium saurashtrense]